jgi:hypothetical protein
MLIVTGLFGIAGACANVDGAPSASHAVAATAMRSVPRR